MCSNGKRFFFFALQKGGSPPSRRCFFLGLRPGPFFEMFLFALRALFSLGLRPGLFLEMFLFALRALFSLGLRPGPFFGHVSLRPSGVVLSGPAARAFLPSGHFASGGELFARPKSPPKTAPSGGPAGPWPHLRPSWGFPLPRPSARVAGHCAKLGACQQCRLKPPRKTRLTCNPPGAIRNSPEKHPSLATLLGLPSFVFHQRGSRGAVQNLGRVSSSF
jgi:hypothetical protein